MFTHVGLALSLTRTSNEKLPGVGGRPDIVPPGVIDSHPGGVPLKMNEYGDVPPLAVSVRLNGEFCTAANGPGGLMVMVPHVASRSTAVKTHNATARVSAIAASLRRTAFDRPSIVVNRDLGFMCTSVGRFGHQPPGPAL
jgi:hypothetical protein